MSTAHFILIASIAIPAALMLGILFSALFLRRRDKRRSPLTNKVLNSPGEQLRKDVIRHGESYYEAAALAVAIGPITLSAWLMGRMGSVDWSSLRYGWGDAIVFGMGLAGLLWCIVKMLQAGKAWRRAKQGLEAELAVGQSLSMLQSCGALVYHDLPTDRGNIDHIVIGQSVVFAVETKSRRKPATLGRKSAHLVYDGAAITHPGGYRETKPIEQARYQAEWLAKFLQSGLGGDAVRVVPLVALPGWYVEPPRGVRPDVLVSNCHSPQFMMGDKFGPPLGDTLRRRIAHVLEQHYPPLSLDPST